MKRALYMVFVILSAFLVSVGCERGAEGPPAGIGEIEGEAGLPSVELGEEEEGAVPEEGEVAFAVKEVKIVLPNDEEVALDSKRISRYAKIIIRYDGEREVEPVLKLGGQEVELTQLKDEAGELVVKPKLPLHNLKDYDLALGEETHSFKVRAPGDINGDGLSDFIVGAPNFDDGTNKGAAYVYFGKEDLHYNSYDDADIKIFGDSVDALLGYTVALGDINGDGYSDIAVGAPQALEGSVRYGSVIVIYGGEDLKSVYRVKANEFDFYVHRSNGPTSNLGGALAVGDVNGDGFGDLLIGEHEADTADNMPGVLEDDAGALHVIFGKKENLGPAILFDGTQPNGTASLDYVYSDQRVGGSVAALDMNGDGIDDMLIGAPHISNAGKVFIVLGASELQSHSLSNDTILIAPSASINRFGISVASRGDLNNDGKEEAIIGALQHVYVYAIDDPAPKELALQYAFAGNMVVGGIKVGDLIGDPAASLFIRYREGVGMQVEHGLNATTRLGCAVSPAGDLNGDGKGDYLVGEMLRPLIESGRAWVNMDVQIVGYTNPSLNKGSHFGTSIAGGRMR